MTGGAARATAILPAALWLASCGLPLESGLEDAARAARYATHLDHVVGPETGLLDHALAECPEKTAAAETDCLRGAIDGAHLSVATVASLIPGCRPGRICRYDHVTRDRVGVVEASATQYVKRWRVDLDLRRAGSDAAGMRIAVVDRDDFDSQAPTPR